MAQFLDPTIRVYNRAEAERLEPLDNAMVISITNPRQSPAHLPGWGQVLRLGFHDCEGRYANFEPMSFDQAKDLLSFANWHRSFPLTVHCEFGASRSVAISLFLSAWLQRPLELPDNSLVPNQWVLRKLRQAAPSQALPWLDWRLIALAVKGHQKYLNPETLSFRSLLQERA